MNLIKYTIIGNLPRNEQKPQLMLIGDWLENIGFGVGTFVSIAFDNEGLTLKSLGTGYHMLVQNMKADTPVIQVTTRLKHKIPLTHLVLNGENLTRYGFDVGSPVTVHALSGTIHIKPINLLPYGINPHLMIKKKICHVHRGQYEGKPIPRIQLVGTWLSHLGFTLEKLVTVTYSPDQITFKVTDMLKHTNKPRDMENSKHITLHSTPNGKVGIRLQGLWLETLGFSIKTPFLVHYEHGLIRITRLIF